MRCEWQEAEPAEKQFEGFHCVCLFFSVENYTSAVRDQAAAGNDALGSHGK